jgi:EAL domain-containing protein (putative c-di-GMP-specific phosphodiesterase class I)
MKIYSYLGSGKPVLATDMPTHTQVLDDQVAVLAKADPESFAAGMLRLVEDEALQIRLGQAGKRLVEERHNFQSFREKVNGLYDWLAADIDRRRVSLRPAARSPEELGKAVLPQELRIYYQPIVSLETGRITGFEALVRWQHPDYGLLSPSEFISMAEETGQIIPIGQWVLHEACRQMREWNLQFPSAVPLTICVNLSAKQLSQPDLIEQIDQVLEETGLDTQSLILEVADRAIEESADLASDTALQLRARGVQVDVDYFAGDSPLSILGKLPVRKLKIAPRVLNGMDGDQGVPGKIQQAVDYARSSGIDVVAVGVETKAQLKRLKAMKLEYGQGNLFSEPLDGEAVEELIAANPQLLEEAS